MQLWRAIIDVTPRLRDDSFPADAAGAFVAVAGRAHSRDAFETSVREACRVAGLILSELEEVEVLPDAAELAADLRTALAARPEAIAFGTFHTYPFDA